MDCSENQARGPTGATPEQIDVENYASLYTGHTKIARLHFIADHCNSRNLELEALRMALDEIRKGENTVLFKECVEKLNGRLGLGYGLDQEWIETVERRAAQRQEKLEVELNGYKTNLIKESIRMGYNDLGDFHYARGDLQQAFKCYVRTRDYCTTSKHIIAMCLNVILVSIELGHFVHVSNYVSKADQTPDVQDPVVLAKLKCAAGLAHLESKKYKLSARKFVDTNFELGSNYSDVIAPQDVATYGGLCALASFDRGELKLLVPNCRKDRILSVLMTENLRGIGEENRGTIERETWFQSMYLMMGDEVQKIEGFYEHCIGISPSKVIDNINFRNFLELIPEVRELIHDFYASRYASCLGYLQKLKPQLLLDIHLCDHVKTLYEQIRHKALIQYTNPFISVDLNTMASAFKTSVAGLEKELAALITENQIQARIDSHNKILYARHADQRNTTFQRVLQTGSDFQRETRAMLLRANLMRQDFVMKGNRKQS